ncbi:MAG: VWA domain-containing protein [Acidobacteriota bacterium]
MSQPSNPCGDKVLRNLTLLLFALSLWQGPATAQTRPGDRAVFTEVADVRRVSVDVVVTDPAGAPVRGLERDDFELRIRGEVVPLSNFSEVAVGATDEEASVDRATLLVLIDQRTGDAALRRSLLSDVRSLLTPLLDQTRGISVATLSQRLEMLQPLTRDEVLLEAAFDEATQPRPLSPGGMGPLLRQIELARPLSPDDEVANGLAIRQASTLLAQIRAQAREDRLRTTRATLELSRLVRALAAQPTRTCVLLLSGGLESTPTELAFRLWWAKFGDAGPSFGVQSIEAEMARIDGLGSVAPVITDATNGRVIFYTLGLGSTRHSTGSAQFATSGFLDAQLQTLEDPLAVLDRLARETGGLSALRPRRTGQLLDSLLRDLTHYYALAFDPAQVSAPNGRLRVRVNRSGVEVRAARRFAARETDDALEDRLMAALFLGQVDNRHRVRAAVGKRTRSGKNRYLVELVLRVPVAEVVLLPDAEFHRGSLEISVAARSAGGGSSTPFLGQMPVEIPNSEVLQWLPREIGSTLQLEISDERQNIGVAVRDTVGRTISTLQLAFDPQERR